MSKQYFCVNFKKEIEEVSELVFNVREKIKLQTGERRYSDDFYTAQGKTLQIQGTIDADTYAVLGRKVGIEVRTTKTISDCPDFVYIQNRKGDKMQVMDSKTGVKFKQS